MDITVLEVRGLKWPRWANIKEAPGRIQFLAFSDSLAHIPWLKTLYFIFMARLSLSLLPIWGLFDCTVATWIILDSLYV